MSRAQLHRRAKRIKLIQGQHDSVFRALLAPELDSELSPLLSELVQLAEDGVEVAQGRAPVLERLHELRIAIRLGHTDEAPPKPELKGVKIPARLTMDGETRSLAWAVVDGQPAAVGLACWWGLDGLVTLLDVVRHPAEDYLFQEDDLFSSFSKRASGPLHPPYVIDRPATFPAPSVKVLRVAVEGLGGTPNAYCTLKMVGLTFNSAVVPSDADPQWTLASAAFDELPADAHSSCAIEVHVHHVPEGASLSPAPENQQAHHELLLSTTCPLYGLENTAVSMRRFDAPLAANADEWAHVEMSLLFEDAEASWRVEEIRARETSWAHVCCRVDNATKPADSDGGCVVQ